MVETGAQGGKSTTKKSYSVTIPPGTKEGSVIRLAGQGLPGKPNGDLLLKVELAPHQDFSLKGHDLFVKLPVSPAQAVLGAKVSCKTLDGEVLLNVPAGAQGGQKFRLAGKGMPKRRAERGDLYAVLQIVIPKNLSSAEKELYEQLAQVSESD